MKVITLFYSLSYETAHANFVQFHWTFERFMTEKIVEPILIRVISIRYATCDHSLHRGTHFIFYFFFL